MCRAGNVGKNGQEIAGTVRTKRDRGFNCMEGIISAALKMADGQGVRGKNITPFLLARVKELTKGVSFASNKQLAYNNARAAAKIAKALCEGK